MAKRKTGKRTPSGRLSRAGQRLSEVGQPNCRVTERRELFSFIVPTKGPDGRNGTIDQDICDGIGQLHALGLLDGNGHDPQDMRDAGRFFGEHYWSRYRETAPKTGKYERQDKSMSAWLGETAADRRFDRMDDNLRGYERSVLMSLVVDTAWGDEIVPWAQSLIDEALLSRKRVRKGVVRFPDCEDRERLAACIRGLVLILDGGMEMRRAA
jgi:hypothetical protein